METKSAFLLILDFSKSLSESGIHIEKQTPPTTTTTSTGVAHESSSESASETCEKGEQTTDGAAEEEEDEKLLLFVIFLLTLVSQLLLLLDWSLLPPALIVNVRLLTSWRGAFSSPLFFLLDKWHTRCISYTSWRTFVALLEVLFTLWIGQFLYVVLFFKLVAQMPFY